VHDLWAVGQRGTVLHFDGTDWRLEETPTKHALFGVWAEDRKNAWAVGEAGEIIHWDGARWTESPSGTTSDLHGIWGPLGRDLWVAGFSKEPITSTLIRRHR